MAQKSKSSFRGKVASNAIQTSKSNSSFGYLRIPKGVDVFIPDPDGKYELDFLPYVVTDPRHPDRDEKNQVAVEESLWYRRPFRVHRNIGAGQDSVVCLSSVGKKCPICEHRAKLVKEGADKEEIKLLNSSKRMLYIVIPLNSKKHEPKIHLFDISEAMFQDKLTNELKENPNNEVFPDLAEGKSVKVRFEGKTIGNSKPFPEADRIDFMERNEQYDDAILDEVPNLDEVLNILSYKELEAKYLEIDVEEDGGKLKSRDDEEEEKPTRNRFSKPVRKEEEEPEEEDKPVRKSFRKPVKEEDEDEPEEKPVRRGIKKPVEEDEDEKPSRKAAKGGECPHGYKFGVETDKFKQCDTCDVWSDCIAEKEGR